MTPGRHSIFEKRGIRLSAAVLLAFLQRWPALRPVLVVAGGASEFSIGAVLKTAGAAAAALGAVDSVAGATAYTLSTGTPGHPSPYTVTTGSQIEGVAFDLESSPPTAAPPESWTLSGSIPPGLQFGTSGSFITSTGSVDASNPTLTGTPTTPGDYTMVLQAWEFTGGTGLSSSPFPYEVVVAAAGSPPPTPTPTPTSPPTGDGPVFTTQPLSVTVAGGTAALDAAAGQGASYQWRLNGTAVPGATDPTLFIASAAAASGIYTCVATNAGGFSVSNPASVALGGASDPGRMINLSARAQVGTGGGIIFGGFAVGGAGSTGSQSVLVRASGPALGVFGVAGVLPDPQLQLFDGTGSAITDDLNTGWKGSAQIASVAAAVGAFAWTDPSSHDAALERSLLAGTYTAQVSGQSGDTGVALVEVYDAVPGDQRFSSTPRLTNLSARVNVASGAANALFAGFVIGGSSAVTVLIRISGPALGAFGVAGVLPDPQLQLESDGAALAANTGWAGSREIVRAAAQVGAFAWSSSASADSALLITLPPGAYTAVASGASGDAGAVLVEIYEVP